MQYSRSSAVYDPSWRTMRSPAYNKCFQIVDGVPTLPNRAEYPDLPVFNNTALHLPSTPEELALFGSDVHVADNSDDVNEVYDIVLVACRKSNHRRENSGFSDTAIEWYERAQALYQYWEHLYNRLPEPHAMKDVETVLHEDTYTPIWIPYNLGHVTSALTIFSQLGDCRGYRRMCMDAIGHVQKLAGRAIRVLILFAGIDGATSANSS